MITVELFGVARLRAGRDRIEVEAASVDEALDRVRAACPTLDGTVLGAQGLNAAYRACVNGHAFVIDPSHPLRAGDHLLIFAADAGG